MMKISLEKYEALLAENPEAIFFGYATKQDAIESYNRKFSNPRFNNDELFVFEIDTDEPWNFIVQTTGSLVKHGA